METSKGKTNILLVDDHTLYREGMRSLIEHWDEFRVVGDVSNGQEALDFCRRRVPDLILMDVQMPVMDGIEASRLIHKEFPDVAIIILTMTIEDENLFEAISYGVKGYILKDTPARQLKNHIRSVMNGEAALSGSAIALVIDEISTYKVAEDSKKHATIVASEKLTESEVETLRFVAQGLSNEEIASHMFLSEGTVKKKLATLMQKLSLDNRVQLAVYAVNARLVD